jgi:hypothetical protein
MKALRNLLLAGAALAPLAPLGAEAQVAQMPGPVAPIVVYDYSEIHLPTLQQCPDLTSCQTIVSYDIDPKQRDRMGSVQLQYLISAKTTMKNFAGSPQYGTCALVAGIPNLSVFKNLHPGIIIDQTEVGMGENNNSGQQSIALQGAFLDSNLSQYPLTSIHVSCRSYDAEVLETVLTVIPFQATPPFNCPEGGKYWISPYSNVPIVEKCTPDQVD